MSFQLSGTLFNEGPDSRTNYSGKIRVKRSDIEALGGYLQHAPTVANGRTDEPEVVLYVKGWDKQGGPNRQRFISLAIEPAASVVRELVARGKMPEGKDALIPF